MINLPLLQLTPVLMGRFIRNTRKLSKINFEVLENYMAYREVEIGQQTHREVGKLWEEKRKKFVLGAKYFLMAATKHLAKFLKAWLALTNVNYHRNV